MFYFETFRIIVNASSVKKIKQHVAMSFGNSGLFGKCWSVWQMQHLAILVRLANAVLPNRTC